MRRWLFRLDPEVAHDRIVRLLNLVFQLPPLTWLLSIVFARRQPQLKQEYLNLNFPTPIGLAAGFDKNGQLVRGLHALGFGFCEVGTVTLRPQSGNPQPRLWRLAEEGALINNMGFNNDGAAVIAARLAKIKQHPIPIGVNIGKNRDTPLIEAAAEYKEVLKIVYSVGDYFVVNVSSPNTPQLRELQKPNYLRELLGGLVEQGKRLALQQNSPVKPILVKLAPELDEAELKAVVAILREEGVSGVIACNTLKHTQGGTSGRPLLPYTVKMVQRLRQLLGGDFLIIAVGGILSPADVWQLFRAGANLVQVYTGLVYRGPRLPVEIQRFLLNQLRQVDAPTLQEYLSMLR